MYRLDEGLKTLIETGKQQGFLTFSQVNEYLPDEAVNPEKLDQLLMSLEEVGLDIINESKVAIRTVERKRPKSKKAAKKEAAGEETSKRIDDPVRMYLTQMGEIPLLSRYEEIALAKKIEVTRKRFRRQLLESDYAMKAAIDVLAKVFTTELPFDRTIKVSVTEGLEKNQVLGRMPHNLKTLEHLHKLNLADFATMQSSQLTQKERQAAE